MSIRFQGHYLVRSRCTSFDVTGQIRLAWGRKFCGTKVYPSKPGNRYLCSTFILIMYCRIAIEKFNVAWHCWFITLILQTFYKNGRYFTNINSGPRVSDYIGDSGREHQLWSRKQLCHFGVDPYETYRWVEFRTHRPNYRYDARRYSLVVIKKEERVIWKSLFLLNSITD